MKSIWDTEELANQWSLIFERIGKCLPLQCKQRLDQALVNLEGKAVFTDIKSDPGRVSLDSVLKETTKLAFIRTIELPIKQLESIHPKVLHRYRQRIGTESAWDVKRHPEPLRYALLAIFLYTRRREIIDGLVDLLIQILHKLSVGAERKLVKEFVGGFRRVHDKNALLYRIAVAALENPDGRVRDVIYPVAGETTLQALGLTKTGTRVNLCCWLQYDNYIKEARVDWAD